MKFTVTVVMASFLVVALSCVATQTVDPALVGTWEMVVPNAAGAALWVWTVRADGTYSFHAEGPGNIPSHHGSFHAAKGQYVLKAANLDWQDSGTYDPPANNIVRMTSGRLGTGYWTRATTVAAPATTNSAKPEDVVDVTKDPFKLLENMKEGIGEDGIPGHFDKAAAARSKARNLHKIEILPEMAAVMAGSGNNRPIVVFYSGSQNIDALIYSDAMAALAGRADFGLSTESGPDLPMTDAPNKSELQKHVFPHVLIVKPRFTIGQIIDMGSKLHAGQSMPPLAEFEWEYLGVKSAQEWAEMIGAELRQLGH